jgi:mRNA interferase RelE/StbE
VHELYLERTAERDLKALPSQVFRRIISHINALSQNPRPPGCHKITGSRSDWRIRVGDYRVIYEIDDKAKIVRVMKVGHRREIYR